MPDREPDPRLFGDSHTASRIEVVETRASRRRILLAGLGAGLGFVLPGCANKKTAASPEWDSARGEGMEPFLRKLPETTVSSIPTPAPVPVPAGTPSRLHATFIARPRWAGGRPVPRLMNRMLPVRYVTVHHDGMTPFRANDGRSAASRLELIRTAHRRRDWGDIGYHFAIDRAGNVWECRPLSWQGAHVKNHNEGNVGIVMLGNFEEQQPTDAQFNSLRRFVGQIMGQYGVPPSRVRTHQEWAATKCPGRYLQNRIVQARSIGGMA